MRACANPLELLHILEANLKGARSRGGPLRWRAVAALPKARQPARKLRGVKRRERKKINKRQGGGEEGIHVQSKLQDGRVQLQLLSPVAPYLAYNAGALLGLLLHRELEPGNVLKQGLTQPPPCLGCAGHRRHHGVVRCCRLEGGTGGGQKNSTRRTGRRSVVARLWRTAKVTTHLEWRVGKQGGRTANKEGRGGGELGGGGGRHMRREKTYARGGGMGQL